MFVIFVIGVKMDPALVVRSGRKSLVLGLSGLVLPFAIATPVCMHAVPSLIEDADDRFAFTFAFSTAFSMSSFAVLVPILSELNLLNSELGRIAMSASMTNDLIGWVVMFIYIVVDAGRVSAAAPVSAFFSVTALFVFIIFVVRPIAIWVVDHTPPGKPVDDVYIFVFLLIVLVVGFYSDIIGTNSFHGALVLGLVIPDGPPLGAALVEKIEAIVEGVLLPLYYALTGLNTDFSTLGNAGGLGKLQLVVFFACMGKLVGILLPSLYFRIPFQDALSLSLFMNTKGIVEVVTYHMWRVNKLVNVEIYSYLMLSSIIITAVVTPIATYLYQPSRRYAVYKRRTIQHLKPESELRLLACVQDQSHVPTTINLLEASYASPTAPIAIYVLHLVELVGRAAPLFIPHKLPRSNSSASTTSNATNASTSALNSTAATATVATPESDHIINAFLLHEQRHHNAVSVHPFTTISPYSSMHDEVCRLAVEKRTSLIILPFHKRRIIRGHAELNSGLRTVNRKVLSIAPCSVGILIDGVMGGGMCTLSGDFLHNVIVFFFGGEDDREALAYGARMANHPGVTLTIIRFLPSRSIREDQAERRLDIRLLDEVKLMGARNKRVVYREALVGDMEEIVEEMKALDESCYDLVMVGMRHRSNSVVSEGLSSWGDCPEIGVVGDFLVSLDFESKFSVLVVKQQDQALLHQDAGEVKAFMVEEERFYPAG
ncbi:cation/H(+) antiporter 15 [Cocos nucifera]|uniref:Cation/H(+) antiporter 15 n=1 Tax=Cocos nucifera TaxID=13894 RepID=A0A8K0IRX8_COCNU|nr:cation/H(+) antiporter 15 [Cocos nucifera]